MNLGNQDYKTEFDVEGHGNIVEEENPEIARGEKLRGGG